MQHRRGNKLTRRVDEGLGTCFQVVMARVSYSDVLHLNLELKTRNII